jgi:two-component system sensor histidine kinase PilS (NtrC family)
LNAFIEDGISRRLKWLMFCRLIFSLFVITGFYFFYARGSQEVLSIQVVGLYLFAAVIIFLTLFYSFIFNLIKNKIVFSVIQIVTDTFLVTFLIYFTGVYSSVFQFFYLVVILYSSSLLSGTRPFWIASLVSLQYGLLVNLKYYGFINDFFYFLNDSTVTASGLFFQVFIFIISSFAVAWLASLLTVQLRKAKKDLKKMDDYVKRVERLAYAGEISAGFAHEIKNPMASLRGSIQLLLSDIENGRNDDVKKLGGIIQRESLRLDNLVQNFLYFARPGDAKKKKINPASEIRELLKIFKEDKKVKNKIEVVTKLDDNSVVEIDPDHFKQIIWNLLINALEVTPENGRIFAGLYSKRFYTEIVIEDSGEGIPENILTKIYDPFFSTKKKGSGLGLSIVVRLTELYNARFHLENKRYEKGVRAVLVFYKN